VIYFIIHNRQQAYEAEIVIGLFFDLASGMCVRRNTARSSGRVRTEAKALSNPYALYIVI
jgi:hypothetical protein